MPAPSITGITEITYEDGASVWTTPATATGAAFPGGIGSVGSSFGTTAEFIGRFFTDQLSAQTPIVLDLTNVNALYGLVGVNSNTGLNTQANNGLSAGFSDGSDNWKLFTVGGSDTVAGFTSFILQAGQVATDSSVTTPDESALTQLIIGARGTGGNNTFNPRVLFDQLAIIQSPSLENGEVGDVASFGALASLLSNTNLATVEIFENSKVYKLQIPLAVNAEVFEDSLVTILFENSFPLKIDNSYYYFHVGRPTATATFSLSNATFISTNAFKVETVPGSNTALDADLVNVNFQGPGETVVSEPMAFNGGSETGRTRVRYVSGKVTNGRSLNDSDLQIDCSPGDNFSAVSYRFSGTSKLLLNPANTGASPVNLSGLTTSGSVEIDNLSANNITIELASAFLHSIASPTTGGGTVTVLAPQPTLVLTNVVPDSRIYIRNTTDGVDLYNLVEPTTEWSGSVPSGKALLVRIRNASTSPKYKPSQIVFASGIVADQTIVINQELDE